MLLVVESTDLFLFARMCTNCMPLTDRLDARCTRVSFHRQKTYAYCQGRLSYRHVLGRIIYPHELSFCDPFVCSFAQDRWSDVCSSIHTFFYRQHFKLGCLGQTCSIICLHSWFLGYKCFAMLQDVWLVSTFSILMPHKRRKCRQAGLGYCTLCLEPPTPWLIL